MNYQWCILGIIPSYNPSELNLPGDLGNGVSLAHVPDWLSDLEFAHRLSETSRTQMESSRIAYCHEYTASSLGDPEPDEAHPLSRQEKAEELLLYAEIASWLVRPTTVSPNLLVHVYKRDSSWSFRHGIVRDPILPHPTAKNSRLSNNDLTAIPPLLSSILSLKPSGALWTAIRLLSRSLRERAWQIRFLQLWIAMEGIYGPQGPGATSYRISQRVAFLLGATAAERINFFQITKRSYRWRSNIVHGMRIAKLKEGEHLEIGLELENLIRRSLTTLLGRQDYCAAIDGQERDDLFDSLIFGDS